MMQLLNAICYAAVLAGSAVQAAPAESMDFKQRNFNTINRIYNKTQYPNNLDFLRRGAASVEPGLFAENATGRISPVGPCTRISSKQHTIHHKCN